MPESQHLATAAVGVAAAAYVAIFAMRARRARADASVKPHTDASECPSIPPTPCAEHAMKTSPALTRRASGDSPDSVLGQCGSPDKSPCTPPRALTSVPAAGTAAPSPAAPASALATVVEAENSSDSGASRSESPELAASSPAASMLAHRNSLTADSRTVSEPSNMRASAPLATSLATRMARVSRDDAALSASAGSCCRSRRPSRDDYAVQAPTVVTSTSPWPRSRSVPVMRTGRASRDVSAGYQPPDPESPMSPRTPRTPSLMPTTTTSPIPAPPTAPSPRLQLSRPLPIVPPERPPVGSAAAKAASALPSPMEDSVLDDLPVDAPRRPTTHHPKAPPTPRPPASPVSSTYAASYASAAAAAAPAAPATIDDTAVAPPPMSRHRPVLPQSLRPATPLASIEPPPHRRSSSGSLSLDHGFSSPDEDERPLTYGSSTDSMPTPSRSPESRRAALRGRGMSRCDPNSSSMPDLESLNRQMISQSVPIPGEGESSSASGSSEVSSGRISSESDVSSGSPSAPARLPPKLKRTGSRNAGRASGSTGKLPSARRYDPSNSAITGFLIDLDGTVYRPNSLIAGACAFHEYLVSTGKQFVYLSNTGAKSSEAVRRKLRTPRYCLAAERLPEGHVWTAAEAQIEFMADRIPEGAKVFVMSGGGDFWYHLLAQRCPDLLGSWEVRTSLTEEEAKQWATIAAVHPRDPLVWVVLFCDGPLSNCPDPKTGAASPADWSYDLIRTCSYILGHGAQLVYTADDSSNPAVDTAYEGYVWPQPGPGMFAQLLTTIMQPRAANRVHCLGKGGAAGRKYMMKHAMSMLKAQGHDGDPSKMIMIGDRFDTDIRAGLSVGIATCLVETGAHTYDLQSEYPDDTAKYMSAGLGHMHALSRTPQMELPMIMRQPLRMWVLSTGASPITRPSPPHHPVCSRVSPLDATWQVTSSHRMR